MPMVKITDDVLGGNSFNKTSVFFAGHDPVVFICDVKVVEALYTTKNMYFDKHPIVKNLSFRLTGNSILFDETNERQKERRKAMTPAFYKGKL